MIGLMIVDDEEGVRRSVKKVLQKDGYRIFTAERGEEAVELVRLHAQEIGTVISDYKMPGIDGLETLVQIGRLNSEITRIMLTGYATMESAIEAVNAGIDGFLTKPFENAELRAKVREYNVKKRLKQFVSEPVLEALQRDMGSMAPRKCTVSVLFTDIRGFSALTERLSPMELSELLNRKYFSPFDDIIFLYNGTLDKHIGDGIMGIYGAPISYGNDVERAILTALSMKEEMRRINDGLAESGIRIEVGYGIATGEVMAGIFGSQRKKEYTALGPTVNIAARLEGLAGVDQILVCEQTYERVRDIVEAEKIDTRALKGMTRKIDIYAINGHRDRNSLTSSGASV
ncbi:MAG: response regulator [Syntrophales bacterium]|jgi:adenylate cyclase|nr:response regulator [Syntrophales bacterium]MDD4340275.1 adenylate/guanylate cyclase domain-containing protein [Syntrophales bacterium]HOS78014.1 adenylate/guanylate cyclase domain-containing protein [Syntrophales bacterium]HPB71317.1 adenylate/guanylate cyclase domain-containing protein [Syntrophales bacterium]HQP29624.1 adenylate/guanylate cyclase domain-containing protein [Syntrophales bacterium]